MTTIRITGQINDIDLQRAGIRPGDEVEARIQESNGAAFFEKRTVNRDYDCVIYPENYEVVNP